MRPRLQDIACKHCGKPFRTTPQAARENPFCPRKKCYRSRLQMTMDQWDAAHPHLAGCEWRMEMRGHYITSVPYRDDVRVSLVTGQPFPVVDLAAIGRRVKAHSIRCKYEMIGSLLEQAEQQLLALAGDGHDDYTDPDLDPLLLPAVRSLQQKVKARLEA